MPLKPGTIRVHSTADWKDAIVETGDLANGAWRCLETTDLVVDGRSLIVRVTPDPVFDLLLLCQRNEAPRWRKRIEQAMCDPASLP
jgi:hypothetical protein